MATKTEKLRAALISRGYTPVETLSQRECLQGPHASRPGVTIYLWLDKAGGFRYNTQPKKTESMAAHSTTIERVLAGKKSKMIVGGVE